jgi:3-phosphoshikimate 1-carboxyvinyltransferase
MRHRPQGALFRALRQLGYRLDSERDNLPLLIHGQGPRPGKCEVSIEQSSQFASALMLCAPVAGWKVEVTGENREESPYVQMTSKLIEAFAGGGKFFRIEPDASTGSYFLAANILRIGEKAGASQDAKTSVEVAGWPESGWQADQKFINFLEFGGEISRVQHLADSIMTAIVISPLLEKPPRFTDLGRLRLQECERVSALRTELTKCGARVVEEGDSLEILPGKLHGAEIETYEDHRMAMCFSTLGMAIPGMLIRNPRCVKKTFPDFFQKLSQPEPGGLGVTILDGESRRKLTLSELFAD